MTGLLCTTEGLVRGGFVGFRQLSDRNVTDVPDLPGVYVVLREATKPPRFLVTNPAGRFKDRDPTVSTGVLEDAWVHGCPVIYIGKARSLRTRLRQYRDHGRGRPMGHWGGRYVWQLADRAELSVSWRVTETTSPREVEARMLAASRIEYGCLPFANLRT